MIAQQRKDLLAKMIRVRCFEQVVAEKKEKGLIYGPVHTTIGQEATDVGVCSALASGDYIIGTHRSHGYMLAKGADMNAMMAEIYGKSTGTNGGKGGSMHVSDRSIGSLGASGIVGSGLPVACGAAFASKYKNDGKITCAFFGDGASNEGTFHESLNIASTWNLPVIFLLKNNGLAITTPLSKTSKSSELYQRASAYGITAYKVDGQNVEAVYNTVQKAINHIKKGNGPILIESHCIRFREHQEGAGSKKIAGFNYRDNEKLEKDIANNDPIHNYSNQLLDEGVITSKIIDELFETERESVSKAVLYAENSPHPEVESAYSNIFSKEG